MPAGCVGGNRGGACGRSSFGDELRTASPLTPARLPGPRCTPARRPGAFDGNVSVLVGGSLHVGGSAAGAEGTVVTLGDAVFARDVPGPYEVGVTALGSQVAPYAGSDMLAVGGNLDAAPGTHVDVGQSLGGDVVVGGGVATGTDLDPHGGRVDSGIADATAPYLDLVGQLAPKSAAYAEPAGHRDRRGHPRRDHPDRRRGLQPAGLHPRRRCS